MVEYEKVIIEDYGKPHEFEDPNQHPLMPIHPSRNIIDGRSRSGKTNFLINLIRKYLNFDKLYICAKNIHETHYSELREDYTIFDGIEREAFKKMVRKEKGKCKKEFLELYDKYKKDVFFSSDLNEFVSVDDLDPSVINIVIFDDCVIEKDQKIIEEFYIRGRKQNASIFYISQDFYKIPTSIRKNTDYFYFFGVRNPREIQQIIREIDGYLPKEEFQKLRKRLIQNRYDFIMLDFVNPEMRYRDKNFEPIKWKNI